MDGRRRLAAIVAADVAEYSRMMRADEDSTIAVLKACREQVIEPKLSQYHGRVANTAGDSLLIEFRSAVDAIKFSMEVQSEMAERNERVPDDRRLAFRIGINVGDVVTQGDDLLGDGVNVAARIEGLAEAGGICVSRSARDQVRDRNDIGLEDLGEIAVKNIDRPVRVFRVQNSGRSPDKLEKPVRPVAAYVLSAIVGIGALASGGWWWLHDSGFLQSQSTPEQSAPLKTASIAVLPFDNLSADVRRAYFADGITEDITTNLSKVQGLYVTSRSATLRFKNATTGPRAIGNELGVRHLLEGSVRREDDKIRITAKLIDATTGAQLWAERFDREAKDIFTIQDEIAEQVVSQISKRLSGQTLSLSARSYAPDLNAYDLYIQGRAKRIPPTPENVEAALELFMKAIELDPKFAGGYAGAAYARLLRYSNAPPHSTASSEDLETALQLAERATQLDPSFGPGWGSLAEAYIRKGLFDEALEAAQRAIEEAPSDSLMRATYGRLLGHIGRPREGNDQVRKAMRMSPDSLPMLYFLGANYRAAGQFEKAIEALKEHRLRLGGRIVPMPTSQLIAAYVQAGRLDEAKAEASELLRKFPNFTSRTAAKTHVYRDPREMALFLTSLRTAGLPE